MLGICDKSVRRLILRDLTYVDRGPVLLGQVVGSGPKLHQMWVRLEQPANACAPTSSTPSGIARLRRLVHSANALSSIRVSPVPRPTLRRPSQERNTAASSTVTPFGIRTSVSPAPRDARRAGILP